MKVDIFAYSDKGCELALKVANCFENASCFAIKRFAEKHDINGVESTAKKVEEIFLNTDLLVFVGATGIAVRAIAPHVKDKTTDPACVVIDDCGRFVISLLSGHIGGANLYTQMLAKYIGAKPIITTATDGNDKFAVDNFAVKNDLAIADMKKALSFSAKILTENLPYTLGENITLIADKNLFLAQEGETGLYIGYDKLEPYKNTVRLVPKMLHVGIGCRRGTSESDIKKLFSEVFSKYNFDEKAVVSISSIDLKKDEKGLLAFCEDIGIVPSFYTAQELAGVEGNFTNSVFVEKTVGVANVCERSAVKKADNGKLLVNKTSKNGVTIAVALTKRRIELE